MKTSTPGETPPEKLQDTLQAICGKIGPAAFTASSYRPGLVRHIVLFRFRSTATPQQRAEATRRFLALQQECRRNGSPYILSIETGAQSSGEGIDGGFEQGFLVTFQSEGDRNYYVGKPVLTDADKDYYDHAHDAYKTWVRDLLLEDGKGAPALVFDFAITELTYLKAPPGT